MTEAVFAQMREAYHARLLSSILTITHGGTVSNADSSSKSSKRIALGILESLGKGTIAEKMAGQTAGSSFESICAWFVKATLAELRHLQPGELSVRRGGFIAGFQQYSHLDELEIIAKSNRDVAIALGSDYLIKPDVVVVRQPEPDYRINAHKMLVDADVSRYSGLRQLNNTAEILHASISCKWTLRSDRAQNARSEALNLVRNRKGALPRISVITAEPLPSRIASLALGTGDIDCVYHFALHELREVLDQRGLEGYADTLDMMVAGDRLKDISDLPLDLVI